MEELQERKPCIHICMESDSCARAGNCEHAYTDKQIDDILETKVVVWDDEEIGECGTGECAHMSRGSQICHSHYYSDERHNGAEESLSVVYDALQATREIVAGHKDEGPFIDAIDIAQYIIDSVMERWECMDDKCWFSYSHCEAIGKANKLLRERYGFKYSMATVFNKSCEVYDEDDEDSVYLSDGEWISRECYDEMTNPTFITAKDKLRHDIRLRKFRK